MAGKNLRKRKPSSQQNKDNNKKRFSSISHDPFFHNSDSKRRNKFDDEDINSSDDEGEEFDSEGEKEAVAVEEDNEEEITEETPAEKKKRLAEAFLDRMRAREKREEEDEELEDEGARREREGERDSLIAKILQQEQLEESGRMRRAIASRVQKPETTEGFRFLVKHRHPVTAVALSEDDTRGFSASKDGTIFHWDVNSGKTEKYLWPSDEVLKSHGAKDPQGRATKHSKHVLALAVSSDGRYLASGGLDRHVHLWDIRTRQHVQVPEESQLVFRAPASSLECCCFISNDEFLSGSDDGSIEHWNILRKKPVHIIRNAHASLTPINFEQRHNGLSNGHIENDAQDSEKPCSTALSWVSSVAVCRSSDLAASGAGNGSIRLWKIESESKGICPLFELPLVGFVNSLSFAKSGRFLIAGVGQEPRLGRWERNAAARNGVALHRLELS
ncbi:U3 snoRNP-associated protein-like YAO isoform X3 [Olea europaea var. sylvestris]|uniref:U3 snoRNP-associated protein-like YAO isoform X3 n=1 Tax=Olea europaea var. sylvestris TaxID=158386 RepID=UPI000C1D1972|nr:U3 snoRNP-associated protein-like YAO isoform X3 [Olea europaea var. sylvestris]